MATRLMVFKMVECSEEKEQPSPVSRCPGRTVGERDYRACRRLRHAGENWGLLGYSDIANLTVQGLECHGTLLIFVMIGAL